MLHLHEEIALLTLDPATGYFPRSVPSAWYIVHAAALADLMIRKIVRQQSDGTLILAEMTHTGDPILDEWIRRMSNARRPMNAAYWVLSMLQSVDIFTMLSERWVSTGIIVQRTEWFLIFPKRRYRLANPGVRETLRQRVLMTDDALRNDRIATFIALVIAGRSALSSLFSEEEWKDLTGRFGNVMKNHPNAVLIRQVLALSESSADTEALLLLLS